MGVRPASGSPHHELVGAMWFHPVEVIVGVLISKNMDTGFMYRFVFLWSKIERDPIFFFETCKLLYVPRVSFLPVGQRECCSE